jgi:drug/metabolite transporter (DMT)-like permease
VTDPWLVAVALFSAANFAGGLVLVARGTRHLPPLRGACISVPTTALLMLAAAPLLLRTDSFDPRGALVFALLGCLFPAAVTLLTFEASRRIGPALTGALGNVSPLFALVFAVLVLGEVPGWPAVVAALVIVGGVVLLFTGSGGWVWPGLAVLLPLAAAVIRGLVQPVVKLGMGFWPDAFAATLLGYLVSAGMLLGVGAAKGVRPFAWPGAVGVAWFIGVGLCNGAAVGSMYLALSRGPVAVVAPLIATYPVFTLALTLPLLGRAALSGRLAAGIGLTVAGVALLLAG